MRRPHARWLLLPVLVGFVAIASSALLPASPASAHPRCPTLREVKKVLKNLERQTSNQRVTAMRRLMLGLESCMANPTTPEEDVVVPASQEIVAIVKAKQYEEVLRVFDDLRLDAGFGTTVCAIYAHLSSEPVFIARYRERTRPIERCVGISFTRDSLGNVRVLPSQ